VGLGKSFRVTIVFVGGVVVSGEVGMQAGRMSQIVTKQGRFHMTHTCVL